MEQKERVVSIRNVGIDEPEGRPCGWSIPDTGATFNMSPVLVNRVKAEVKRGLLLLPKRGAEVGGILLGRVISTDPLRVDITDFEPVPCEYRFGPTFILSDTDLFEFRRLLSKLAERRGLSIIGYFRSCTGRDLALDNADGEMMRNHFPEPESFVLSLRPLSLSECTAWFFFRQNGTLPTVPTHPPLPFDDLQTVRSPATAPLEAPIALSLIPVHDDPPVIEPAPEPASEPAPEPIAEATAEPETEPVPESVNEPVVEPLPEPMLEIKAFHAPESDTLTLPEPAPSEPHRTYSSRGWHWITLILMLLIASAAGYYFGSTTKPKPPTIPSPIPQPSLEVVKQAAPPSPSKPASAAPANPLPPATPAALTRQAEPDISPGIRARIQTPIVINVDVRIDASGKVTGAAAKGDGDSVFRFLAEQAALAARASTFRPARAADGSSVPSVAMLSFTFEPQAP